MIEYRQLDLIKQANLVIFNIIQSKEEEQAKLLVKNFLKEFVKKANIKNLIIQYCTKSKLTLSVLSPVFIVLIIQSRIRQNINLTRARMFLLSKYFSETAQKMTLSLVKTKKDQKKVQRIQQIDPSIKDAVLRRYLNKCKLKHAFLFFEWRRKRRRVRVMNCVEMIASLRNKVNFMDEALRQKLLGFGVEGLAQIEERRIKYENKIPIDSFDELQLRAAIRTFFTDEDES